jgi:hypothetical protein
MAFLIMFTALLFAAAAVGVTHLLLARAERRRLSVARWEPKQVTSNDGSVAVEVRCRGEHPRLVGIVEPGDTVEKLNDLLAEAQQDCVTLNATRPQLRRGRR